MNEDMLTALAVQRGPLLDQPDLGRYNTAGIAWQAWAPAETLVVLPPEVEDLIDIVSATLGHLKGAGWRRRYAWERVEAAAWGRARPQPVPAWPDEIHPVRRERDAVLHTLAKLLHRHHG